MKAVFAVAIVIAAISLADGAAGQAVGQEDLRRCAEEPSPERKLACYEALTVKTDEAAEAEVIAAPVPARQLAGPASLDTLGEEHLDRSKDEPEEIVATVVEVSEGRRGVLYFHLENGQVWRQLEARRFRYPKDGKFEATITTGMMGDYRLRIGEDQPMTRIRRVE